MITPEYPKHVTGILVERFGGWHNAKIGTLPLRPLRAGEVLIKSEAAALYFQHLLIIEGRYQFKQPTPF